MKKIIFLSGLMLILFLTSCQSTFYTGSFGQSIQTQVILSKSNFKVLGSFSGTAIARKSSFSIKKKSGLISLAKKNLLENAKKAGIELKGSRTLINISTDVIQNKNKVKVVVSADIIEFINN